MLTHKTDLFTASYEKMKKIHILKQPNKQVFVKKCLLSTQELFWTCRSSSWTHTAREEQHGPVQGTACRGHGGMGHR